MGILGARLTWSVRRKYLAVLLAMTLIPLLAYAGVTYFKTSQSLSELESEQLRRHQAGVQHALAKEVQDQARFVHDYAVWDGFAFAIARGDQDWIADNVTRWVPSNSEVKGAQVYRVDGGLVASGGQLDGAVLRDLPEFRAARAGKATAGFEALNGRVFIVSAETVKRIGHRRAYGVVVFVRPVTDAELATLALFTGAHVAVVLDGMPVAKGGVGPAGSGPAPDRVGVPIAEDGYSTIYSTLGNSSGEPVALVKVAVEREALAVARSDIRGVALVALAIVAVIAIIVALLLARAVSRPLRKLVGAAVAMAQGETRQRINAGRNDEIGILAGAFNEMSEKVATHIDELSARVQTLSHELVDLNVVGETLAESLDVEEELTRMMPMIARMFKADFAWLFLTEPESALRLAAATGDGVVTPLTVGEIARRVIDGGKPVNVSEVIDDRALAASLHDDTEAPASVIAVPLVLATHVTGVLAVGARETHEYVQQDIGLLATIAAQVAVAVQNAHTYAKLEDSYLATVTALASAMEAKDEYTAEHAETISAMAVAIGEHLGLGDADLRQLQYAAVLHDVGKIGVPGSILNKPARLSKREFAVMAEHTAIGAKIVSRIEYLRPVAPIIRAAHERWDGTGYPDRLIAEEIPLQSRILFVCDAYDAMTTDRPYRAAMGPEPAIEELRRCAGSQFDPAVVEAFLAVQPRFLAQARRKAAAVAAADFGRERASGAAASA